MTISPIIKKWFNKRLANRNSKDFEIRNIIVPKKVEKMDYLNRLLDFDSKFGLTIKKGGLNPYCYFNTRHLYGLGIYGEVSEARLREIKDKQLGILATITACLSKGSSTS